ncbi:MAG: MlaD family protein [Phycisphaerales bacterium JB059]
MSRLTSKNNVLAGLFLVGSLLVAVVISFILGDLKQTLFMSSTDYVVRYPLDVGATGLKPGSDVTLGGQSIGRVTAIEPDFSGEIIDALLVTISVDSRVRFYPDAKAGLVTPLIGSISTINFSGVGTPESGALIAPGDELDGQIAPGLLAQAGIDAEVINNIKSIIARIDNVSAEIEPDIRSTAASVREFAEKVNERLDTWDQHVTSILRDLDDAADEARPLLQAAQRGVADARGLMASVQSAIRANRSRIDRSLTNVQAITERARFETIDKVNRVLDQGSMAVESFSALGDEANLILSREGPEIHRTVANVRKMSEQGNLMVAELRAQPWRVLKPPPKKDLEKEPLYNAARSYAQAVGDLRAASESLESVIAQVESDGRSAALVDPQTVLGMTRSVESAFERYQVAERQLLQLLIDRGE